MTFRQKVPRNGNLASFRVGTAQGQQLNVMAASLLDQNSRSLFHKQRVLRAFFSLRHFFGQKLQTRLVVARRRLDGWSAQREPAEPQRTRREFLGLLRFSVLDVAPGRLCPQSQLLRSPSKPVTTITASNPGPIARYWSIAWFTTYHHAASSVEIHCSDLWANYFLKAASLGQHHLHQ